MNISTSLVLAVHAMLKETGNLNKLNNHTDPEKCPECGVKVEPSGWVSNFKFYPVCLLTFSVFDGTNEKCNQREEESSSIES